MTKIIVEFEQGFKANHEIIFKSDHFVSAGCVQL